MAKVTVDGQGKAKGAPDIAIVQVRVQNEAKDQATCRRENNIASEAVISTLKKTVQENDLYVVPAQVRPNYDYSKTGRARNKGFMGWNTITAKVRKLDEAQDLLTEINNIDVNKIQVVSFSFDIDDKKSLEDTARRAAFQHAKAKADTYAQETGLPVSGVVSIEENLQYGGSRHPSGKFAMASRAMALESGGGGGEEMLEMGDIEVTVNIAATFKLGED